MYNIAKLWLKIALGFTFSVFVMILIISYALMGTVATDTLEIVVTEATGFQHQEVMIQANLQPLMIVNFFWLSISILAFCLIFLYFLDMNLKSFLAPGFLSLVTVLFMQIIFNILQGFIPPYDKLEATGYIFSTLERANQVSWAVVIMGIVLMAVSIWGQRMLEDWRSKKYGSPAA